MSCTYENGLATEGFINFDNQKKNDMALNNVLDDTGVAGSVQFGKKRVDIFWIALAIIGALSLTAIALFKPKRKRR